MNDSIPNPESDRIAVSEVEEAEYFAGALFRRKFGSAPPAMGHHVVTFGRGERNELLVLGYAHFFPFGDIILVGGVCTDGSAVRAMSAPARERITAAGGVYLQALRFGFARFASQCEAFFGYCGDRRAEEVNLAAGFVKTEHTHLLVNFHKPLPDVMRRALIAKAAAIGPF